MRVKPFVRHTDLCVMFRCHARVTHRFSFARRSLCSNRRRPRQSLVLECHNNTYKSRAVDCEYVKLIARGWTGPARVRADMRGACTSAKAGSDNWVMTTYPPPLAIVVDNFGTGFLHLEQ